MSFHLKGTHEVVTKGGGLTSGVGRGKFFNVLILLIYLILNEKVGMHK